MPSSSVNLQLIFQHDIILTLLKFCFIQLNACEWKLAKEGEIERQSADLPEETSVVELRKITSR